MLKPDWKLLTLSAASIAAAGTVAVVVTARSHAPSTAGTAHKIEEARRPPGPYIERKTSPLIDKLDFYFSNPDSPRTYRALNGLGDPDIKPWNYDAAGDNLEDADKSLLRTLGISPTDRQWENECRPLYAVKVLNQRRAEFGAAHPYVAQWTAVQRAVFEACATRGGTRAVALLAPMATSDERLRVLQAQDRAYQQASLDFYRDDKPRALLAFQLIAASGSPHRGAALYMILSDEAGEDVYDDNRRISPALIRNIEAALSDPSLADIHPLFQALLGRLGNSVGDAKSRAAQVDAVLAALAIPQAQLEGDAALRERYARALTDVDRLHQTPAENVAWWRHGGPAEGYTASRALMNAATHDALAAWLLFPAPAERQRVWGQPDAKPGWTELAAYAHSAARTRGGGWVHLDQALSRDAGPSWAALDAEIDKANAGDEAALAAVALDLPSAVRVAVTHGGPRETALALEHLSDFPWTSAYVYRTTVIEALRALMLNGRIEEARQWRDRLKPGADPYPWYDDGPALLALLAEDQGHLAPATAPDHLTAPELLDALSIKTLQALAADERYAPPVRALFARTAWTRTYALGMPVGRDLDRLMRDLNPEVTRNWVSTAGDAARPNNSRVLFDVLGSPAMNIKIHADSRLFSTHYTANGDVTSIDYYNHSDNDWWCARNPAGASRDETRLLHRLFQRPSEYGFDDGEPQAALPALTRLKQASFLFRSRDDAELAALSRIDSAPKTLTLAAIAWTRHAGPMGDHDRESEALARAVVTTRYGCPDQGGHGAYSRAAFERLHSHYRFSEAAEATPYWFDHPQRTDDEAG